MEYADLQMELYIMDNSKRTIKMAMDTIYILKMKVIIAGSSRIKRYMEKELIKWMENYTN